VKKYYRLISIVFICLVVIVLGVAFALAHSNPNSKLGRLFGTSPTSVLGDKQKTDEQKQNSLIYAALGDSVAAGSGLTAVNNATPADERCARSKLGYPAVLASQLHAKLIFAACGGATATDLTTSQNVANPHIAPQLDAAFKAGTPDLITVTLGANDTHWIEAIQKCYEGDCGTEADSVDVDTRIAAYRKNLRTALEEIAKRSNGKSPQIILTGYYGFGSPTCLASLAPNNITPAEVTWFDEQTQKLADTTIATAQQYKNTSYVSIDATFDKQVV
jgi:lysophospholipase L1-like esterase